MGQKKDNAGALTPFLFRGRDELIDDGLGAVDEVPKLGFPHHQGIRALDRVAVLKREGRVFTQQRVINPQASLVLRHVHQGQPLLTIDAVMQDCVTLHESTASGILANQTNRGSLQQE